MQEAVEEQAAAEEPRLFGESVKEAPVERSIEPSGNEQNPFIDLMDDNLQFKEGWTQKFAEKLGPLNPLSATLKESKAFGKLKDFPNLLKSYIEKESMIGADKIVVPKADSSKEVWDAYYRAGGVPESPDQYEFKSSEEFAIPDERKKEVAQYFHERGFSQKHMDAIIEFRENESRAQQQQQKAQMSATREHLIKKWGGDYNKNMTKFEKFFDQEGMSDFIRDSGLGNMPEFYDKFDTVISKLSEDDELFGVKDPLLPGSAEEELKKINSDPSSPYHPSNRGKTPGGNEYVENLYKQIVRDKEKNKRR